MQSTAKASTKISDVDASTRSRRRRTAALSTQAMLRAEVQADKARKIRKRIHHRPTSRSQTLIPYQMGKIQTNIISSDSSGQDVLNALQRAVVLLPWSFKIQDVALPLSNGQEATSRYTWRDCEAVLQSMDAEPEPLPELEAVAARYRALVRSNV